jgi:hypothetical protein
MNISRTKPQSQKEHRGSDHITSETFFGSTSWSRHEIHAGTFVNSDHEARAHQISRRSGQRYHDFGAIALRDKIR